MGVPKGRRLSEQPEKGAREHGYQVGQIKRGGTPLSHDTFEYPGGGKLKRRP